MIAGDTSGNYKFFLLSLVGGAWFSQKGAKFYFTLHKVCGPVCNIDCPLGYWEGLYSRSQVYQWPVSDLFQYIGRKFAGSFKT
jgi:hypothetical protein